jgi:hypothetical protein
MSKQRNYLFDWSDWKSVLANVIAGIILFYITANLPSVWLLTQNVAKSLYKIITTAYSVPLWILVPLIFCTGFVVVTVFAVLIPNSNRNKFDYHSFTEASYDGIKWKWQYGEAGIHSPRPYCPKCDCVLVYTHYQPSNAFGFSCDRCRKEVARSEGGYDDYNKYERRIIRLIDQELRHKENMWQESREQKQD